MKMFDSIIWNIKRIRLLRLRTNMIISLCGFVFVFLAAISVYGLLNFKAVQAFKIDKDLEISKLSLDKIILGMENGAEKEKNLNALVKKLKNSEHFSRSILIIMDKSSAIYADNNILNFQSISKEYASIESSLNLIANNSVVYRSGLHNKYEHVVCAKLPIADLILLAFMPDDLYSKYNFPAAKFILFSTLVVIFALFTVYINFKKTIYNPIVKIEKAIHGIVDGEVDLKIEVNKKSELYPISESLNIMVTKVKDLIGREYNEKILRKQAELNALQSQINPHFLYNTLESIRGQALEEGVNNIANMSKALSNLFRYSISRKSNMVSLGEELKNVDNYLIIQQYRFSNKFNIKKIIEKEEHNDIMMYRMPKLTIQPIVENAIYHGLETKSGKGDITIKIHTTQKRLIISVEDNGVGMEEDKVNSLNRSFISGLGEQDIQYETKTTGIGLFNVNERIRLYFGERYGIRIYSTLGVGTTVEVVIPLITEDISDV
jgi:signal transduction histidine kinase